LKAQGRYALLLTVLLFVALVRDLPDGNGVVHMILFLVPSAICAGIMGVSRWTPAWVVDPDTGLKGGAVFVLSGPIAILYCITAMIGVVSWQIEEPLSRSLAMLACAPTLLFTNIMGWSALIYGILPDGERSAPSSQPKWSPPESAVESVDLRSLRHSRMRD